MAKKDYQTILIEQLVDQNKAILEYVGELPSIKRDIVRLKADVAELKSERAFPNPRGTTQDALGTCRAQDAKKRVTQEAILVSSS